MHATREVEWVDFRRGQEVVLRRIVESPVIATALPDGMRLVFAAGCHTLTLTVDDLDRLKARILAKREG